MAQLLVRQLELAEKEALRRRARRHGRSMEEEARLILRQALALDAADALQGQGLGSRIASLFAEVALEEPICEWHGEAAAAAVFEP